MVYREADDVRDLKVQASEAVELAMDGRWEEAAAVNRKVIAASPSDLDAYNRLGKALLELGDPQAARACLKAAEHVGNRIDQRRWIVQIMAGDRLHDDAGIGGATGQRSDMIKRLGQIEHAVPTDPAPGRLQPDGTADRGRVADRPAGIAAQSGVSQPRRG